MFDFLHLLDCAWQMSLGLLPSSHACPPYNLPCCWNQVILSHLQQSFNLSTFVECVLSNVV